MVCGAAFSSPCARCQQMTLCAVDYAKAGQVGWWCTAWEGGSKLRSDVGTRICASAVAVLTPCRFSSWGITDLQANAL